MEPSKFAQQNAERAMETANFGLRWAREFAEQTLSQSKAALDGFLKASNEMAKDFESQSSAIREHTTALTEKALSNSVDYGKKCLRAKEQDEFVQLQTEFMSQQAQIFAEQAKELSPKNSERNASCLQYIGGRSPEDRAIDHAHRPKLKAPAF